MTVILAADSVRVEFGSLVAVDDLSFELSGGQVLGLVGPGGSGCRPERNRWRPLSLPEMLSDTQKMPPIVISRFATQYGMYPF